MTTIKVILLFTQIEKLGSEKCRRLKEIVIEEYGKVFKISPDEIQVSIHNGTGKNTNADIHLLINDSRKYVNEATLRKEMKTAVSKRLRMFVPTKGLGFGGVISSADDVSPDAAANNTGENRSPVSKADKTISEGEEKKDDPEGYKARAEAYTAVEPKYSFKMLRIHPKTLEQIDLALDRVKYEKEVFGEWGLYAIMPNPVSAMSFYGPPGTGKSMAAEAIADRLGKKIIRASYADIENKYVGEGPKNVKAIFLAAEQQDAVLFIDEADSLLSKRLTNVSDGSGQAINSMRSQLLMSIEQFHGVVIFATNLVVNYDKAFLSRLISIEFLFPDAKIREEIWKAHIRPADYHKISLGIPLSDDVNEAALAEKYEVCGRDIRNAVVNACVYARKQNKERVDQSCFVYGIEESIRQQELMLKAKDETNTDRIKSSLSEDAKRSIEAAAKKMIEEKRGEAVALNRQGD